LTARHPGPILVHSDPFATMRLIPSGQNRQESLAAHVDNIRRIGGDRAVWMPSFNYDFTTTGRYDLSTSPAQVGTINERFRITDSTWRSETPVFNFVGNGEIPVIPQTDGAQIDPFDESSLFGRLADLDGEIIWYGAPFSSTTFLHYAEAAAGGPPYRYDKYFSGTVTSAAAPEPVAVSLKYHVRPMGATLGYDWVRLLDDLVAANIYTRTGLDGVATASARQLREFWVDRLNRDPLYFLDSESRAWVAPKIRELGRRFEISDFEGDQA